MKVVFLTRRFYPDIGGVEKHVYEVGKRLVRSGYNIAVVTQSQGKEKKLEGIEIVRIPIVLGKIGIWKWIWQNRSLIKEADVIHAHDVYFWYFPFRFLFPFKKSFVTFHGYESYPIRKKAIMVRKLSEYLANGNIIVGDFIKKWYHSTPNYIIYGGVEISNIKYKILNRPKRESAVFVGRLDEQTGILEYAKAVDLIKKDYRTFEFGIIGDGVFRKDLKKYKPLGFRKDATDYLKRYNFAFVSRYLSILEALASKRLVFAHYDNPVKGDYLKMSPFAEFIIIENSGEKIAEKVKYYLKNPKEADRLIEGGYRWVKKQTWDGALEVYLKIWGN